MANPSSEILNSTNLKKLKIGKVYGPITSVILGRVPQNDNVVMASEQPEANIITSVDTGTNLFTVVGHSMEDGSLVRVQSTGTLPEPLQPDTNYYAFTNGSADTFALTYGYEDALTGDSIIDLSTSGSGTIQLSHIQTQEVQINNNQIMDDDRQDLLPNIYKELVGLEWREVTAETVGLGWHEVGDVVIFEQGDVSVFGFIDEVHVTFDGSIKETLVSSIPDVATINYQTAGGILKTIYNTEIKVDKQENDITSIVSQQDVYATEVQENFTQVYQDIDSIDLTIQKSGGGNLIRNSVGFATDKKDLNGDPIVDADNVPYDRLSFWEYNVGYDIDDNGTVTSYSSSESQNAGGTSGQVIRMVGTDVLMKQRINVAANTELSLGVRVNNAIGAGNATITLSNDNDTFTIEVDDANSYEWEELLLENFVSSQSFLDITVQVDGATDFQFTDMRLLYGTTVQGWVQSPSEILSANVQFTTLGMRIFDNVHDTTTQVTYNEFSTRRKSDDFVLFEADDSGVVANDVTIKGVTNYNDGTNTVIRQVTIPESSDLAGIAFIKVV